MHAQLSLDAKSTELWALQRARSQAEQLQQEVGVLQNTALQARQEKQLAEQNLALV